MDAGPILYQHKVALNGDEKSTQVLDEMFVVGANKLVQLLPQIFDGTAPRWTQDDQQASTAPKISPEEGKVDFAVDSALAVHNKVRGFASWPGTMNHR